jgi:dihydropteroate synthase
MGTQFEWDLGKRKLELGERPLLMGVVNVTPDSFSDGGEFLSPERAREHALRLLEEGADILDIGGESTRPGAKRLLEEDEVQRVIPVIAAVKRARPDVIISVDTYKATVAKAAVEAGAEIINDVSGFTWDAAMLPTLAKLACGVVLMHMRGRPEEWRTLPPLTDPVGLVKRELVERAQAALTAGVAKERMVLDPGLGFGKNFAENHPLLARISELRELGFPLLAGASRKSFVGRMLAREGKDAPVGERQFGTVAAETVLALAGVQVIRTHDVRACADALRVVEAVRRAG